MAQYTSDTALLRELPESLPSALDTEVERLPYIQQASALADSLVGPDFSADGTGQRFPDATDTPATPPIIELATRKLAASMIVTALGVVNSTAAPSSADTLRDEAMEWFRKIREREIAVTGTDGSEHASADRVISTTDGTEPTFRMGRYDSDGELLDDTDGSIDGF
jgi:hypothetical protein